jgi:anti-sigma factor RsiW
VTHDELRTNIDAWAIGALPEAEARQVEAHLAECVECQADAHAATAVAVALAESAPDHAPSSAARPKLMSVLDAGLQPAVVAAGLQPAVVAAGLQPRTDPRPFVVRERPSLAARTGWLVAAASLVLAAYLTWDGLRLRDQVATLSAQLAEARALNAAGETRIAALQHASEQGASAMAILTAPDLAQIDLAGQPEAPDARARAFWSRERGMVFSASKLPPPPPGKTYQVWVVTDEPAPISAGLIEPDLHGHVEVVFATPPDIPQPKAVAVTLEPAGGVPAPTGAKYLVWMV